VISKNNSGHYPLLQDTDPKGEKIFMADEKLTNEEKKFLLKLAREVLEKRILGQPFESIDMKTVPQKLQEMGASFVTLKKDGRLRGCIGTLEPYQSLVEDVCEHVISAAFLDYRFPPLILEELQDITIGISRLTKPEKLDYVNPDDLLRSLRPGIDGVVLRDGSKRATFLPQVWEKIPNPEDFLSHLCNKMGVPANTWRQKKVEVLIYKVEDFNE
jgi:AmmeMemoRadiSam system protein A